MCFDDSDSIIFKTNYVKENNLRGISLFSLDFDDFTGKFCMSGKFPLLNAAKEALFESNENNEDLFFIEKDENSNSIENTFVKFYN